MNGVGQPNAPGTQGYNRYAYTANNPTTWTDPSGHSVSDSIALVDDLQGLVNNVVAFANAITPLLPAIMALGPFGFGIALFIFYKFLLLAVEILLGIALVVSLLIDSFQFYNGENPTDEQTTDEDELTEDPESICSGVVDQEPEAIAPVMSSVAATGALMTTFLPCMTEIDWSVVADLVIRDIQLGMCMIKCVVDWVIATLKLPAITKTKTAEWITIGFIALVIIGLAACTSSSPICWAVLAAVATVCVLCAISECREYIGIQQE